MVSAGAGLMGGAWALGHFPPKTYTTLLYGYNFLAWIYAASCIVILGVRSRCSYATLNRALLVLGVFGVTVFPLHFSEYQQLSSRTLALAGTALFFGGLVAWHPAHRWLARLAPPLRWIRDIPPRAYGAAMFIVFLSAALSLAWICFSFIPGFGDSLSQYIQAKFIARGHLYGPTHPLQAFFDSPMTVLDHGKWYAQYSPGHIFMMALGHLVHASWLVNPLEGALTIAALYALARRICDEATAKIAALLMLLSQFTLLMSAEYMNHSSALLFTTLFLLCYVKTLQALPDPTSRAELWAMCAGLSLGALFLTRPLSAFGIGIPFGVYALVLIVRQPRAHLMPFVIMAMGSALCVVFQLWYDQQLTGDMWLLPSGKFHRSSNIDAMGYSGSESLWKGLRKMQDIWDYLNLCLFEWFVPSTLFLWLAIVRPLKTRYWRLLLAMVICYSVTDMANQFHSHIFGPRYVYETSTALFILSAIGITRIPAYLARWPRFCPERDALTGIIALTMCAIFAPAIIIALPHNIRGYSHYFNNHPDFSFPITAQASPPALVFIEAPAANSLDQNPEKKYDWMAYTLPPFDDNPVIFAKDLGKAKNRLLMQYYPDRNVYLEQRGTLYKLDRNAP